MSGIIENSKIQPSFNINRQTLGEVLPLDTPLTVFIDTSERCNFRCAYCFRSIHESTKWSYVKNNGIMSMETFEVVASQLLRFPSQIKRISLSNHGEPLFNMHLFNMIRHIKDLGLVGSVEIHTNASLLTQDSAYTLAKSGIDKIVISIQGTSASAYYRNCGVNIDFARFCDNLGVLYRSKSESQVINIKIVDTALSDSEDEERFINLFSQLADKVFIEKVVPLWSGLKDSTPEASDLVNKYGESFPYINCCMALFCSLCVTPEGDIYPCQQIPPLVKLGHVKETSLVEAWNSATRINLLKNQLLEGRSTNTCCLECYIPQNSVKSEQDIFDDYNKDIFERLKQVDRN